jgi:signal transduction histidine kinase
MNGELIINVVVGLVAFAAVVILLWREHLFRVRTQQNEIKTRRKLYELAILQDIGDKMGYSFDVERVVGIITGSLRQFIEYTTVSYVLQRDDSYHVTIDLNNPVSKKYIQHIRIQMKQSLETLLDREIRDKEIHESVKGAFVLEEAPDEPRSYFNIPLVVNEHVVGLLHISHIKAEIYTEEDMAILYKIVSQASQAVTKLEHVVQTEQSKLSALISSLHDGVIMTDREHTVLIANPAVREILGVAEGGDVNLFDHQVFQSGRFDIVGALTESIAQDTVVTVYDVNIHDRSFKVVVSPVKGESDIVKGKILGAVIIFHDVTQEQEIERLREDFNAVMIHELRGPLDGIKKISEVMRADGVGDKKAYDDYVRMIHESSSHMLEMVNDLLDAARIKADRLELSPRPSKLSQVIEGRLGFFDVAAQDKHITITSHISEGIPDTHEFDPIRIEQVLNNLLSNALKFSEEGGAVRVDVFGHAKGGVLSHEAQTAGVEWFVGDSEDERFGDRDDCVVVSITDSGVGMSQEQVRVLFGRFDQKNVLTQNKKNKSLGLGLVIVKGIIEKHGGIVGVASKEGKGSTFYFSIAM